MSAKPTISVPRGAWDTHFHVFNAAERAKASATGAYAPMDAPVEKLDAMHRRLGIDFGVVVQSTAVEAHYGDFIELLEANPRLRGVIRLTESASDSDLAQLHAAGVRGIRFALARFMKQQRPTRQAFERDIARARTLGWHVKLHVEGDDLLELEPWLRDLGLPVVIDHCAHLRPGKNFNQPAFDLLQRLQDRDNVWVLLCNFDRWSDTGAPAFADMAAHARKILMKAPDRVIWGTDWPHPMYRNPYRPGEPAPEDVHLLDFLGDITERDAGLLERVLVTNPKRLYGP